MSVAFHAAVLSTPTSAPSMQVVFMGQGEPAYNYRNVKQAVRVMKDNALGAIPAVSGPCTSTRLSYHSLLPFAWAPLPPVPLPTPGAEAHHNFHCWRGPHHPAHWQVSIMPMLPS